MTNIPSGYQSLLDLYETQEGIALIKHTFVDFLCKALNLKRVSAPLFVEGTTGLNDDLNGIDLTQNAHNLCNRALTANHSAHRRSQHCVQVRPCNAYPHSTNINT